MRKVVLFMHMSLDGFIAGPNGELDWGTTDEEMTNDLLPDLTKTMDTVLLGRMAYQDLASYWPFVDMKPSSSQGEIEFGHWIDKAPKVVFSRLLEEVAWQNARVAKGDIAGEIIALKQQPGKDLVLFGGVTMAQTFVQHGLINEYQLVVHPVALARGKPLFQDIGDRPRLKLIHTRAFRSGAVLLSYQSF